MNSRKAQKEVTPKRTYEPVSPVPIASRKTKTITHHALIRAFRFLMVGAAFSDRTDLERIHPAMDESARNTSTPPTM
jgi:hypothetical protein